MGLKVFSLKDLMGLSKDEVMSFIGKHIKAVKNDGTIVTGKVKTVKCACNEPNLPCEFDLENGSAVNFGSIETLEIKL